MIKLPHAAAAYALQVAGITWSSSGNCSDRNNRKCTSFDGIRLSTLWGIIKLKLVSGCKINITGGTEVGHAQGTKSHGTGYKIDISPDGAISSYITTNFKPIGKRASDNAEQYKSSDGDIYARESNHWDITFD